MKIKNKIDFYVQATILIASLIALIIFLFAESVYILSLYFVVGIPQAISYLIRLFLFKHKTILMIVYGLLVMPLWILIILMSGELGSGVLLMDVYLFLNFFISPLMAIFYVIDYWYTLFKKRPINSYPA